MFTGIITTIGTVEDRRLAGDLRLRISADFDMAGVDIGASIACEGVCLTVVAKGPDWFEAEASAETCDLTTIGEVQPGDRLNLERALRLGDELGGHLVSGHVDGRAELISITPDGDSHRLMFRAPEALARFIAPKGSVTLNGTSLTVNEVQGNIFGVNMIPHTFAVTTWGEAKPGDLVNIEIDMLARYVARLADYERPSGVS